MAIEDLRTIKQVSEANPGVWTEASLRWLVFNAAQNGLDEAILKVGRRVLIDVNQFNVWLESKRLTTLDPASNS